ncbi:hypothetical protein [Leisingera sp.]|uniref:hypothetical protein n=1 Tax=Leisingera sp. TaxID=1879318 RepID=UPI002B273B54|nr:hypothetical protein [Leisingera sp.]
MHRVGAARRLHGGAGASAAGIDRADCRVRLDGDAADVRTSHPWVQDGTALELAQWQRSALAKR